MTAEIIQFPARPAEMAPPSGETRLTRALQGLEQALAEQRAAIAEWRASLNTLHQTVQGVGQGLQRYRGSLDRLHADVMAVNGQAVQLEHWADSVLTGASACGDA